MAIISNAVTIADAGAFSVCLGSMVLIKTLTASSSGTLSFVDVRRFGKWKQGLVWSENRGPDPTTEHREFFLNVMTNLTKLKKPLYEALMDQKIRNQLKDWEDQGYGHLPVCMAKTQYSFTTDPTRRGAPTGHSLPVREVRLSAGAGFVVVVCGDIMTMPGLPRVPAANNIDIDGNGEVVGLF